jgi:MtrB/PioB family decaheme-associated outer membrane protein
MGRITSIQSGVARNAVAAALVTVISGLIPGLSYAQENSAPPGWTCSRCLAADGWELDIKAGPAYVGDDDYKFGDYTGLDDDGVYLFGDALALYRDQEGHYVNFEGFTYSSDAGAFFLEGGRQGVYELRASYQAIPRRLFDATQTPYVSATASNLSLPAAWVRAPNTQGMTALGATLQPVSIKWDWDVYGFGVDYKPNSNWKVRADYTRREREGQRRSSGSFLFNAVEIAEPIDYTSDDLELAVSYGADWWQTSLTYYGSIFNNDNESLQWDNPFTSGAGADAGQQALAPDNESHQVSLAGSMTLPRRTTLNGQVSYGHMTQDEDLLPYTTNNLLGAGALPVNSADAEVDTLNVNLRAVSSPWRKVTFEGELRYNDFNNKTPVNPYSYVNTDSTLAPIPVSNAAYDYERRDIRLRGEYRLNSALKLQGGANTERFVRNRQDRIRTTTDRLWAGLRSRVGSGANVSAEAFIEDRGGSDYETVVNTAAQENPLMRKYNMADRERQGIKLNASVFKLQGVDFGWEFEYSKDDYDSTEIGLLETKYTRLGADISVLLRDEASFYASIYNEKIENDQANSQTFSTPDWSAQTDDKFTTATAGVTYPDVIGPLDATFEYTWSRAVGEISNNTSGLPGSFPDLRSKRQNIRAGLSYPYNKRLVFGFDYLFESLDSDDWALDGVGADTINNLLALGADSWNYNASVFYLSVRYQLKPH